MSLARRGLMIGVPVALLALAGWALVHEYSHLKLADVTSALSRWSALQVLAAVVASVVSFLAVGAAEYMGLRWLKAEVKLGAVLKVSMIANGLAHALGAALLVGAAIRVRLYARRGVDLATVAAATLYQSVSFTLGLFALLGLGLLGKDALALRATGWGVLAGVAAYVLACGVVRVPIHIRSRAYRLPTVQDAVWQIVLGLADNILAVAVLWALLPTPGPGFWAFVDTYVVAYIGGAASGVPSGAGVFEAAVSKLAHGVDRAGLAAALLGFRLIFYLLPLIASSTMLLVELVAERREAARNAATRSATEA